MKNKKITVSIGITAYNEEANIEKLLLSLLSQKRNGFEIKEIVVLSDGSNDKTISIASSVDSNLIKIIDRKARKGKVIRQNEILKSTKSDVLVLLDADVIPANDMLLRNLIKPIFEDKADLVSGRITPLAPSTLVEKVINLSSKIKTDFFEKVTEVNEIYLCHGRVRAFSKTFRKKLQWPKEVYSGEDAYSYLFCMSNNFKFYYQPKAHVLYRSPSSLQDHLKQSVRFMQSKRSMKKYFEKDLVDKSYRINKNLFLKMIFDDFISNPFLLTFYLLIYVCSILISFIRRQNNQLWEISFSSKKLT